MDDKKIIVSFRHELITQEHNDDFQADISVDEISVFGALKCSICILIR